MWGFCTRKWGVKTYIKCLSYIKDEFISCFLHQDLTGCYYVRRPDTIISDGDPEYPPEHSWVQHFHLSMSPLNQTGEAAAVSFAKCFKTASVRADLELNCSNNLSPSGCVKCVLVELNRKETQSRPSFSANQAQHGTEMNEGTCPLLKNRIGSVLFFKSSHHRPSSLWLAELGFLSSGCSSWRFLSGQPSVLPSWWACVCCVWGCTLKWNGRRIEPWRGSSWRRRWCSSCWAWWCSLCRWWAWSDPSGTTRPCCTW